MNSSSQDEHQVRQTGPRLRKGIAWFRYSIIAIATILLLSSLAVFIIILAHSDEDYGIAGGFFFITSVLLLIVWMMTALPSIIIIGAIRRQTVSAQKIILIHDTLVAIAAVPLLAYAMAQDSSVIRLTASVSASLCIPFLAEAAVILADRKRDRATMVA